MNKDFFPSSDFHETVKSSHGISAFFKRPVVIHIALGLAAGTLCGFLGTGGGIVLIFALGLLRRREDESLAFVGVDKSALTRNVFAETIAIILPLSVVSAAIYLIRGDFALSASLPYLPAAVAGGVVGAILNAKLNAKWLNKIFAVLIIWAGICMII